MSTTRDGFPGDFIQAAQNGRNPITVEDKKPLPDADESRLDTLDLYEQDDHWIKLDLHLFTMDTGHTEAVINYIGDDLDDDSEAWVKCNAEAVMKVEP